MTVEEHIFHFLQELRIDFFIDFDHAGVDYPHIHPGFNGVIEKGSMHGLPYRIIAAIREGNITDPAADLCAGAEILNHAGGFNKIDRVFIMFRDACTYRKDVGVKNDILRRKPHDLCENLIRPYTDRYLPVNSVGLSIFVKGHDHHGSAIFTHQPGMMDKSGFSFFHGDAVDNTFPLYALQPGLDDIPLGGIDHKRKFCDVRFGTHQMEKIYHHLFGIQQAFIHIDVQHLRAAFYLL